jgi:membrane-bound metal-dependent hydrolase YbcI (DUF457 family)
VPSPVAHIGAALALHAAIQPPHRRLLDRVALLAAMASVAPDLDVGLAAVLPGGLAWHRGPTHSILGAALIGAIFAVGVRTRGRAAWATIVGAAVLHVGFDWSTGDPGAPARYGVPWAWPVSAARFIDPHPWFGAFHIDEAGFLGHMVSAEAIPVYGTEIATVLGLWAAAALVRAARRRYFPPAAGGAVAPMSTNS